MKKPCVSVKVSAYAGYRGEETPRKVYSEGKWHDVVEIRKNWLEPGKRFFDIKLHRVSSTMRIYYDEKIQEWFLCMTL